MTYNMYVQFTIKANTNTLIQILTITTVHQQHITKGNNITYSSSNRTQNSEFYLT